MLLFWKNLFTGVSQFNSIENVLQIDWKAPVMGSFYSKIVGLSLWLQWKSIMSQLFSGKFSQILHCDFLQNTSAEGVVKRCSVKKVFLKISQNPQENTWSRVSESPDLKLQASAWNFISKKTLVQVFSCEFCEIFKNVLFYRTHLVAASDFWKTATATQQSVKSILVSLLLQTAFSFENHLFCYNVKPLENPLNSLNLFW